MDELDLPTYAVKKMKNKPVGVVHVSYCPICLNLFPRRMANHATLPVMYTVCYIMKGGWNPVSVHFIYVIYGG